MVRRGSSFWGPARCFILLGSPASLATSKAQCSTEGGTRTHKPVRTADFESAAFAIPPLSARKSQPSAVPGTLATLCQTLWRPTGSAPRPHRRPGSTRNATSPHVARSMRRDDGLRTQHAYGCNATTITGWLSTSRASPSRTLTRRRTGLASPPRRAEKAPNGLPATTRVSGQPPVDPIRQEALSHTRPTRNAAKSNNRRSFVFRQALRRTIRPRFGALDSGRFLADTAPSVQSPM